MTDPEEDGVGRRSRIMEVVIAVAAAVIAAAITSGISVAWSVSGTVASSNLRFETLERERASDEAALKDLQVTTAKQETQAAVSQAYMADIQRQLQELNNKFDRRFK